MADLNYYKSLEDYESIKDYLQLDPEGFEIPVDLPEFQPDFSKAIIVDNLPCVGKDKFEKLNQVVLKIYKQVSDKVTDNDIYMPFDESTGLTYGFCFIKFFTKEEAEIAIQVTNGYDLSKTNKFRVSLYSDLEKYANYSEDFMPIEPPQFKPRPDVIPWLTDSLCRDQFVTRYGSETEISWFNYTGEEPTICYGGEREKEGGRVWCESYVSWSPQGSYLATFHVAGIKLWGGESFEAQCRFMHPNVELVDFSPCENYMVTYRFDQSKINHATMPSDENIIVWDIRNGTKLRTFPLKNPLDPKFQVQFAIVEKKGDKVLERVARGRVVSFDEISITFVIAEGNVIHENVPASKVTALQEPNRLKWSHDGKYLARTGCDLISVYELPSMSLVDKKSLPTKDVLDFVWSPSSNLISYWAPAVGNHPSLVNIVQIPSKTDLCSRKIFDVSDGKMVWQSEGDYLCVSMTKTQGKKRTFVLVFFRVCEQGVPVEQLEFADPILHVSWEPSGDRVCVVSGEIRNAVISFYTMLDSSGQKQKKELTLLFTLRDLQCNDVLWSPAGDVAAITYYASDCCVFHLHDVENNMSLNTRKHDRGNRLVWDPSGRVIVSCTICPLKDRQVRSLPDDGYIAYTFQGNIIANIRKEKFYQFQWRPRPRNLLSPSEKKKIIKNLKKYERLFEKEDRQRREVIDQEILASRYRAADEIYTILYRNKNIVSKFKHKRMLLRAGYDEDDDRNYHLETVVSQTYSEYFLLTN
jgi:translation initiation factor 3 subunit B